VIEVVRSVRTTCPLDVVADYLSDFTTSAEWDPHTAACSRVGDGVGVRVGVSFDNTQRIGLLRTTMRYTVSTFEAGSVISLHSHSRLLDAEDSMTFADEAGTTVVTYTARFELHGPAALAEPLLKLMLNKVADDGARGMQRTLDGLQSRDPWQALHRPT
jgi:Polyketide cyclase / dehydrase and lipid transport